jgi:hypothetical protein
MSVLPLLFGLLLLLLVLYLGGWLSRADARNLASWLRRSGGVLALLAAAFFLATRNIGAAIFLASLAYPLLRRGSSGPRPVPGQTSASTTAYLEMSLDHASGRVSGRILKGRFAGRRLEELQPEEQVQLAAELAAADPQGARLFEAYLDRVSPGWRSNSQAGGSQAHSTSRTMSVEEAYLMLDLKPGATRDEVLAAHRNLMKRNHPDQGGSTYIASKLNEAKTILLQTIKA